MFRKKSSKQQESAAAGAAAPDVSAVAPEVPSKHDINTNEAVANGNGVASPAAGDEKQRGGFLGKINRPKAGRRVSQDYADSPKYSKKDLKMMAEKDPMSGRPGHLDPGQQHVLKKFRTSVG
jgi:hypothetical protein